MITNLLNAVQHKYTYNSFFGIIFPYSYQNLKIVVKTCKCEREDSFTSLQFFKSRLFKVCVTIF